MSKGEMFVAIFVAIMGSLNSILLILDRFSKNSIWKRGNKLNMCINFQNEARRILELGKIEDSEYNQLCEMYDVYKKMGGDGYADKLKGEVDEFVKLSIRSKAS